MGRHADVEEALEALAAARAELACMHAFKGFNMTAEEALMLLKNQSDNTLTKEDKDKRDRLVAAVDNLIEFSVCEEYQLYNQLPAEIDLNNPEEMADYYDLCEQYNHTYAAVENSDIEFAMGVALGWIHYTEKTILTYMTQGDHRVRPWHAALEGFSATPGDFPAWMIPPIEWGCRCYLVNSDGIAVHNATKSPDIPKQIDGVFSESVAKCGRIFGKSHSYFKVKKSDKDMLKGMVERIKVKYGLC